MAADAKECPSARSTGPRKGLGEGSGIDTPARKAAIRPPVSTSNCFRRPVVQQIERQPHILFRQVGGVGTDHGNFTIPFTESKPKGRIEPRPQITPLLGTTCPPRSRLFKETAASFPGLVEEQEIHADHSGTLRKDIQQHPPVELSGIPGREGGGQPCLHPAGHRSFGEDHQSFSTWLKAHGQGVYSGQRLALSTTLGVFHIVIHTGCRQPLRRVLTRNVREYMNYAHAFRLSCSMAA